MDINRIIEKLHKTLNTADCLDAGAAVVVLLRVADQGVQVLLVKRAEKLTDPWSGQTAFPGGKRDPADMDLKETVVRETLEETGIHLLEGCRFLGAMEPVRSTQRPEMKILPFVVVLQEKEHDIELNEELTEYFWVPLKETGSQQRKLQIRMRRISRLHYRKQFHLGINLQNLAQSSFVAID